MKNEKKVIILGVDGLDPSLTSTYLKKGNLPNFKKYIEMGSTREDLVMLGAMPTVTPPMWTTLATGTYPATHGITDFWNQDLENLDTMLYSFDSRKCKAEQLWNVFAEEDVPTLVWHWPGSSWPPSSDSEYLSVVDGTSPPIIQFASAVVDGEKNIIADTSFTQLAYLPKAKVENNGAGCIINDLAVEDEDKVDIVDASVGTAPVKNIMLTHKEGELALEEMTYDVVQSPITDPTGWSIDTTGAKEFSILTSNGLIKRPCLILPNSQGLYDKIAMYKKKTDDQPLAYIKMDEVTFNVIDEIMDAEGNVKMTNRHYTALNISPDGSNVNIISTVAMNINDDKLWHPKDLYQDIIKNVGYVPPVATTNGNKPIIVEKFMLPCWKNYLAWQANCLNYLIENRHYEMIFSHCHKIACNLIFIA